MVASKNLFVTGASGYVGTVILEMAIAGGYAVRALSRSRAKDSTLKALNAVPVRGDLTSLDVLRRESAAADGVIHLASAFNLHSGKSYADVMHIDIAAVDAIADGLAGSNKPLVTASGSLVAAADPSGGETDEASPLETHPIATRVQTELHSLALASRAIRVSAVRLAPFVYGRGGSGVGSFMHMAAQSGSVVCVDGGHHCTTVVHVDDSARLYLLALQKGKAGEAFNASSATNITMRQVLEGIAQVLGLPVHDLAADEAQAKLGPFLTWFFMAPNRASGAKAVAELGWRPKEVGVLEDISRGSYVPVAKALSKGTA